jgi:LPS-assembly lipoprotein
MSRDGWSISSSDQGCRAPTGRLPTAGRRHALGGALALLALGGCGFRPLYGRAGPAELAAGEADLRAELLATRVPLLQERFGQLIRRALLQRLGSGIGGPREARYELRVGPGVQAEGVGVQRDGTATRVRYVATANWLLVRLGPPPEGLISGSERTVEAYNIPPNQFFAADSSREATEQRLAETLAELVVTRVAVEFRRRAQAGAAGAVPGEPLPAPGASAPESLGETLGQGALPGLGSMPR